MVLELVLANMSELMSNEPVLTLTLIKNKMKIKI